MKDLEWSILLSAVMGYRAGKWDIPALEGKTVPEKCAWLNKTPGFGAYMEISPALHNIFEGGPFHICTFHSTGPR